MRSASQRGLSLSLSVSLPLSLSLSLSHTHTHTHTLQFILLTDALRRVDTGRTRSAPSHIFAIYCSKLKRLSRARLFCFLQPKRPQSTETLDTEARMPPGNSFCFLGKVRVLFSVLIEVSTTQTKQCVQKTDCCSRKLKSFHPNKLKRTVFSHEQSALKCSVSE